MQVPKIVTARRRSRRPWRRRRPYRYRYRPYRWRPWWYWTGGIFGIGSAVISGLILGDLLRDYKRTNERPMNECTGVIANWIVKDKDGVDMCTTLKDQSRLCFFDAPKEDRDACYIPAPG